MLDFKAAENLMAEKILRASQETQDQRDKRHQQVCVKCVYAQTQKSTEGRDIFVSCNYILAHKHQRPCAGVDCVKEGIYEPC